jgi:hypothetical protein
MKNIPYGKAIGVLMYTMLGTRPDIVYAMMTVSKISSNPGQPHWEAVKRILIFDGNEEFVVDLWR